jgi:hypothetical protein
MNHPSEYLAELYARACPTARAASAIQPQYSVLARRAHRLRVAINAITPHLKTT